MTSQINASAIDETYPVSGVDNDSQGFRDNFSATQSALLVAKAEITDLQNRAVVVADTSNDPAVNNLLGSTLSNGLYTQMSGVVAPTVTVTNAGADIDLENGPFQLFTMTANAVLTFKNWPTTLKYAKVRVHFIGDGSIRVPTLSNGTNVIKYAVGFPSLSLAADGKHKVIEAWTYNGGTTVYIRYIGEF